MWDYSEIDGNEWQFPPHSSSGTDTTSHCIRTSHLILFPYANNHARIDPCIDDWKGIVCSTLSNDDDVSVVQELQLGSFNLSGSLPDQVFKNFNTSLSVLNISNNMLTGTIPSSTILLTNLTRLILFLNGLSGSIPSELSELRSLWDIGLHENSLTGEVFQFKVICFVHYFIFSLMSLSLSMSLCLSLFPRLSLSVSLSHPPLKFTCLYIFPCLLSTLFSLYRYLPH